MKNYEFRWWFLSGWILFFIFFSTNLLWVIFGTKKIKSEKELVMIYQAEIKKTFEEGKKKWEEEQHKVEDLKKVIRLMEGERATIGQPTLLYAIRRIENGRKYFEYGIPDGGIPDWIKADVPKEYWQFETAQITLELAKNKYIELHDKDFLKYLAEKNNKYGWLTGNKKNWQRNVIWWWKKLRK